MAVKKNTKTSRSITLKVIVIGVLILLMMIPLMFISGGISGRLEYRDEATRKITDSWGGQIAIVAPMLNVPYIEKTYNGGIETHYSKTAPAHADIAVDVKSETRYIGIFDVPVFTATVSIKGKFDNYKPKPGAFLTLELSEFKGLASVPKLNNYEFKPAEKGRGIDVNMSRNDQRYANSTRLKTLSIPANAIDARGNFAINYIVRGSGVITFVPIAKDNTFVMNSNWANPNFGGNFLPETKDINRDGFTAKWRINNLAAGVPTSRLEATNFNGATFSTSFLVPVDNYRNVERAIKYGFLFIMMTFLACFIFEIVGGRPIHPFQYMLAGFAMTIFYILLLSLSEFMSFWVAYFIAAASTVGLITSYVKIGIAKDIGVKKLGMIFGGFTVLYGFLYILLQLQDMALIIGSIGLFSGLATAMYTTRNVKWYDN